MRGSTSTSSLRRFFLSKLNYECNYSTNYHSQPLKASLSLTRKSKCDESQLLHYLRNGWHHEALNILHSFSDRDLHAHIVRLTSLLTNFTCQGYVDEARILFDIMPHRNIVTYNAMLSGYLQTGMINHARRFFDNMPERNVVSWTAMIAGYANAGKIEDARKVFDEMPEKNVVSWNSMVMGFIRNGELEEARMVLELWEGSAMMERKEGHIFFRELNEPLDRHNNDGDI